MDDFQTLWEVWIRQAAEQGDLTREEWQTLCERLGRETNPGLVDLRDEVLSFADNELLLLWHASLDWDPVQELHEFIRDEMIRRATGVVRPGSLKL